LAQNVESFLAENKIERTGLESFALRPFEGGFDSFYVSTVARGLAGSKSDVDLILVSNAPISASTTLSSMLFHAGRRVGVKLVNQPDMGDALDVLHKLSDQIAVGRFVAAADERKRIPMEWQDLERLINGVSFVSGTKYIRYLPWLSRWMVINTLQEFQRQVNFVRLALVSGNLSAASAYAFGAVVSAMDAVMAACGQVQSNTKWTFERWRRFTPGAQARKACEAIALVSDVKDVLTRPLASVGRDLTKALTDLQAFLWTEFVPPVQLGSARFDLSDGVHRDAFLPGADSICGKRIAAVVDAAILDQILSARSADFAMFDSEVARAALRLLQVGALSCNIIQSPA